MFKPATREKLKARIAVDGPSGSGKTYTSLRLAFALVEQMKAAGQRLRDGNKIAIVDSEKGSASKYVGEVVDGIPWRFDADQPVRFSPKSLADAVHYCAKQGYGVLIIDSLTHYWDGPGGILDMVGGNFKNWSKVRPIEAVMWDAITGADIHVICTMRTKAEYVISENARGKPAPEKVGTVAKQREGAEYEFDIVLRMDSSNTASVEKTRCPALRGNRYPEPGTEVVQTIWDWLERGSAPKPVQSYGEKMLAALESVGVSRDHARLFVGAWPPDEWTPEQHKAAIAYLGKRAKGQQVLAILPSESDPSKRYILIAKADAPHGVGCDCEAGQHGKECKHVTAYRDSVAPPAEEAPAAEGAAA